MAFAPTQIHMSQHALVDGFFAFWALLCLWLLWENLQTPKRVALLMCPYCVHSRIACSHKGDCFLRFRRHHYVVRCVIIGFNLARVTRQLLLATVLGPLLGLVILVFLAGGLANLVATYQLSVSKNYQLAYAILTGDGHGTVT